MKIKGTLTGCAGEPFTGVKYTATLKTAGPVSCSVLRTAGEPATGAAKYKWTPKAKASTGTLSMPLTETPDIAFSGEVTTGSYSPLTLTGTVTESYTGGATCGEKIGIKDRESSQEGHIQRISGQLRIGRHRVGDVGERRPRALGLRQLGTRRLQARAGVRYPGSRGGPDCHSVCRRLRDPRMAEPASDEGAISLRPRTVLPLVLSSAPVAFAASLSGGRR